MPTTTGSRSGSSTRAAVGLSPLIVQREIDNLLLDGKAQSMYEAENLFLDSRLRELVELVGELSEVEAANHEAVQLLVRHGSRPWEDALL